MLPSFAKAYNVNGFKKIAVARDCRTSQYQFYAWSTGRQRCPNHRRQSVDRALGANVDWTAYDQEVAEFQANRAQKPAEGPQEAAKPRPAPTPPETVKAPPAPAPALRDEFEILYEGCI